MAGDTIPDVVLDLRGLWCPQPVLRAKTALRTLPAGGILVLECTDPLTEIDVPHFARQTGHLLAAQERREGGLFVFRIVKGMPKADPAPAPAERRPRDIPGSRA